MKRLLAFIFFYFLTLTTAFADRLPDSALSPQINDIPHFLQELIPFIPYGYETAGLPLDLKKGTDGSTILEFEAIDINFPLLFKDEKQKALKLGRISLALSPDGPDHLMINMLLPRKIPVIAEDKSPVADILNEGNMIKARWSIKKQKITHMTMEFKNLEIRAQTGDQILFAKNYKYDESLSISQIRSARIVTVHDFKQLILNDVYKDHRIFIHEALLNMRHVGLDHERVQIFQNLIFFLSSHFYNQDRLLTPSSVNIFHEKFRAVEHQLKSLSINAELSDVVVTSTKLPIEYTAQHITEKLNADNLQDKIFPMQYGLRVSGFKLVEPAFDKRLIPSNLDVHLSFETLPKAAFWGMLKDYFVNIHAPLPDVTFFDFLRDYSKKMSDMGTIIRLQRAILSNDHVKFDLKGGIDYSTLAKEKYTANLLLDIIGMNDLLESMTMTYINNPNPELMSMIVFVKFLKDLGISQEGVRLPNVKHYEFTIDKDGSFTLNHIKGKNPFKQKQEKK